MASLHNTLFLPEPDSDLDGRIVNTADDARILEVSDNNYNTGSPETDITVDISDAAGNAADVDFIWLKYKGTLTSYIATPSGGSGSALTRTVPTEITNWNGETVSLEFDGFKHDLYAIEGDFSGTSLQLEFTGSSLEIVDLMVLRSGLEFRSNENPSDFELFDTSESDRNALVDVDGSGEIQRSSSISTFLTQDNRPKHEIPLAIKAPMNLHDKTVDEILDWFEANRNFVFVRENSRYPEQVYRACVKSLRIDVLPRHSIYKGAGDTVTFTIVEQ